MADRPAAAPARGAAHASWPRRIARALFHTLVLLLLVDLGLALVFDLAKVAQHHGGSHDLRSSLPNYRDHARAAQVLGEMEQSWRYRTVPFEGWRRREWHGRYVNIDASGSRYDPASSSRGATRTVHFFGGSTMWGSGVADDETIPAFYERMAPGTRAVNDGESGWVSRQSVERLISLINQDRTPDAAVFYGGVNDVLMLCNGSVSINGHMRELDERDAAGGPSGYQLLRAMASPTMVVVNAFVERFRPRGGGQAPPDRCATPEGAALVARTVINNWTVAHDLMAAHGRPLVAALQPVAYVGHPRLDHLRGLPRDLGPGAANLDEYDRGVYLRVYPLLQRAIAERHAPWLVDLTDAFDGDAYVYIDYCHSSANGSERIATRLRSALASLGGP